MKRSIRCLTLLLTLAIAGTQAQAKVTLPSIIGSHMVLQRDVACPIWGWADAGEEVTVEFGDQKFTAKPDANGKWSVSLPPMKASSEPRSMTIKGSESVTLEDILVGEVWLCSGQSNMEWTVASSNNPKEEASNGNHPRIRHIKIPHTPEKTPQVNVKSDGWKAATPETVPNFTAVGYFFGRDIVKNLDVPVGLIGSNWGGTRIEPWIPPVGFQGVPALKEITDKLGDFPVMITTANKNDPSKPITAVSHQSPLSLYNGMINPLVPYAIRGALWYQGESNNGEGALYAEKMKALIQGWRSLWNNPEMPFLFVQLAPYTYKKDPMALPAIWEAQADTLKIPNTGMAVTTDISNIKDIHPRNKQDVGHRLALWALANVYGQKGIVYSGPLYQSMKVEGSKVRLSFDHVGGGLVSRDGQPLTYFQVAGSDKKFVDATAAIEGNTVVVSSADVTSPTAVRFGWLETAEPNLSNKEGLPAGPFRTER